MTLMNKTTQNILKTLQAQVDFCLEANRKATFKSWVFKDQAKCSARKLAEAGFVFSGNKHEPDAVKCFFCNKSLDCWDEDDDPWREHQKHSPNCSFAKMDKPEKTFTLTEFLDVRNELIENFMKNLLKENIDRTDSVFDEVVELLSALK
ncbi:hypothetical protein MTP99_008402 [Tenebrio molitor]|jgi:baculoviral IAP repeat-containing protein 5|nr:hypothetical protein MTP99_008402 [Tenebrio molitor]CAH1367151.1 unnamed protein product [Tenebrio molitor]